MQTKFRLWLPSLKKLSYDDFYISYDGQVMGITNGDIVTGRRRFIYLDEVEQVKDYIINQSTGLKDENGVEIFEDDILEGYQAVWHPAEQKWTDDEKVIVHVWYFNLWTEWQASENHPYSECGGPLRNIWKPKVIGNIHENLELLKNESY